ERTPRHRHRRRRPREPLLPSPRSDTEDLLQQGLYEGRTGFRGGGSVPGAVSAPPTAMQPACPASGSAPEAGQGRAGGRASSGFRALTAAPLRTAPESPLAALHRVAPCSRSLLLISRRAELISDQVRGILTLLSTDLQRLLGDR